MKLPTIRQNTPAPAAPVEPLSPLEITATQTINDRAHALVMQEVAYGLDKNGKSAWLFMLWVWLTFTLLMIFIWFDDIKAPGLQNSLNSQQIISIISSAVPLVLISLAYVLWSRFAMRRKHWKYRRHLRRLGETQPQTLTFRFDGEGITTTTRDDMAQLQPWHDGVSLREDGQWLSFVAYLHELCIIIPKRDLNPQQIEAVKDWNEKRIAGGLPEDRAVTQALAGQEIACSEEFTSSRDDLIATMMEVGNSRAWRRQRAESFVTFGIGFCFLVPLIYLIGWGMDVDRLPFAIALPIFLEMFATTFWKPALVWLLVLAGFLALYPLLRRWGARYYADQALAKGLGRSTVFIGENGIWDNGSAIRMFIPWAAMHACRITPDHIFLTIRLGAVLAYPKRIFPGDRLAAIEALFNERAGRTAKGEEDVR
ncbi:hypothetical protein GAO09_12680 [Rhizobiales bacterium RZME27]|uniref:YcxB-like C-terminal domain-containing protein n=1 Tax=Endobacterium cereale TaxID=2663029 RepID=A0A6A8A6E7_9HYPH|nr:YcxB family protein [Endobacterium cereale]MEB2844294.1 YcxB family protein [Endobacterium cereale]MQY46885.1 hypothetical protein [Endobacterium cereale]